MATTSSAVTFVAEVGDIVINFGQRAEVVQAPFVDAFGTEHEGAVLLRDVDRPRSQRWVANLDKCELVRS